MLVIGAGPSGLAAARQLHRFGIPVSSRHDLIVLYVARS